MSSVRKISVDVLDLKPKLDRLPVKNKNELKPLIDKVDAEYETLRLEKKTSNETKKTSNETKQTSNPFVADLMATKNHKLNIKIDGIYDVLKELRPDQRMTTDAKDFIKRLLEETGAALLKNPNLWTKLTSSEIKKFVQAQQDKAMKRLKENDGSDDLRTKVLEKSRVFEGQTMYCNTAVRLSAMLAYLCGEILQLAGDYSWNHGKSTTNVYFIRMGIASDDELHRFFRELGIETGATKCLEIPKGYKGYPLLRKDGSHAPPFDPILCFKAKQSEKQGVDGRLYRTNGNKWEIK
jgi:hypothetical protein